MRRARNIDANQPAVVMAFRQMGATVEVTSDVGRGFPDCVVRTRNGTVLMVEIKDGSKPPSRWQLSPDELKFAARWGTSYVVVKSEDEARRAAMR